jgi:hypothetical protein
MLFASAQSAIRVLLGDLLLEIHQDCACRAEARAVHHAHVVQVCLHDAFLFLVVLHVMDLVHLLTLLVSCLRPFNDCNCPAGNSFFSTYRTKAFGPPTFYRHWCSRCIRQQFLHRVSMWCNFWALAHNAAIDIANLKSCAANQRRNVFKKH